MKSKDMEMSTADAEMRDHVQQKPRYNDNQLVKEMNQGNDRTQKSRIISTKCEKNTYQLRIVNF